MIDDNLLEQDLARHRDLRENLTCSWNAFFAKFGRLRPIQLQAIPVVLQGKDVLITAPTAGGKTEAVVAPTCERLIREKWPGLSAILITPTRALVNDLFERLEFPVGEMGIQLGRKTSDHAISSQMSEQFLITTPESLESLLTFHRERLQQLRTIIIDEIHLLDGTPRGDQLRTVIQRLRLYLSRLPSRTIPLQMLALSATLPNARKTAGCYLGPHAELVCVAGQRTIDSAIIVADGEDSDPGRIEAAVQAAELFDDVRKMLVFCNSRKAVDASGHFFQAGRFASAALHCHHGSLSKAEREKAEQRFKQERFAVCVSTMTLEIGIDIGDVDLVVCMSPPSGICSFLQRIGRGCRRLQGKTRVLCVARDRAEELIFEAIIAMAQRPLPIGPNVPFRRSVLIQQVLAYLRQVDKNRRTFDQFKKALTHADHPRVDDDVLHLILRDMCEGDLIVERNGVYEPGSRGWEFIQSSRIYANIKSPPRGIQIVDVETGKQVSTATRLPPEAERGVRVAGRSFEVVGTHGAKITVRGSQDSTTPPNYDSRRFPYAYDIGIALAARCGCRSTLLVGLAVNDSIFVMTWLGRLQNTILAHFAKKQGIEAVATCFSLRIPIEQASMLLGLLQGVVKLALASSEIDDVKVEMLADLGPHLDELSADGQKACRRDWFDKQFLEKWIGDITEVAVIDQSDARAVDLIPLAMVK